MREALLLLVIAGALFGLWHWSMNGRDRALAALRRVSRELSLQVLDDSLVLRGLRLTRDAAGRRQVLRIYRFDFTVDGRSRHSGDLALAGRSPQWALLRQADGDVYLDLQPPPGGNVVSLFPEVRS